MKRVTEKKKKRSFIYEKSHVVKPLPKNASVGQHILHGFRILGAVFIGTFGVIGQVFTAMLGFITCMLIIGAIAGTFIYIKVRPEFEECRTKAYDVLASMSRDDFSLSSDTEVYDKDGNQIGLVNAGHYEYVPISDISMNIQNAYIAQEDRRFKIHAGIDYTSILRAGLALVKHNGAITQGGSTITQQVVKNVFLTQERSFTRKITEILLAPEIEKKFSKADIMEFYCNGNYYGNRCYGVETASQFYFAKPAKDINVWEAALLAGISNSPTAYDPIKNPEASLEKRNDVLESMHEVGYLTDEELADAKSQPLSASENFAESMGENYMTSYAIHCACLELMKNDNFEFKYVFENKDDYTTYKAAYDALYSEKSDAIRAGGYQIYTSLDSHIQERLQTHIDDVLKNFTELQDNGKFAMQGSAVVVDNKSDYVVAIVGGRGTDDQFNRGYLSSRQPGSTIKPLIDYAPAFETGQYYPTRFVDDHKFDNGPNNSGGHYYGNVTVREALNRSLNTVAWQVLQDIGVDTGMDYLGKLRFMNLTYVDNGNASMSIGGFTNGARVVDMAKGYSTLANDGQYSDKTCITGITSQKDGELYKGEQQKEEVYSADTAYMITDILKGTFTTDYGTGRGLEISVPCAGKTGTTNSSKDTWFCGYSKNYTTAVWVGYDIPRAMPGIYGATYAGRIWHNFMEELHTGIAPEDWEMPETVNVGFVKADGFQSETETGWTDLFSTNADLKAAQTLLEKQQERQVEISKESLNTFLDFQIESVADAYNVETNYQTAKMQIDLIEDEAIRKDLGTQLENKKAELDEIVVGMAQEIKDYETQLANEAAEQRRKAAAAAEEKRANQDHNTKISIFNSAVAQIENLEYQADNIAGLTAAATTALKNCVGFSEYNSLKSRLDAAVAGYSSKMTKEAWQAKQEAKASAEAAQKAANEAEQNRLDSQYNSTTAGSQGGPGVVGPGTATSGMSEGGPGAATVSPAPAGN